MDVVLTRIRRRVRQEHGVGVVTALMVATVVFVLGATWASVGVHQFSRSGYDRWREQALNAAEAGINSAVAGLARDEDHPGSVLSALGNGTGEYEVSVALVDPNDPGDLRRLITSTGYAPAKDAARAAARRLVQQVTLVPAPGSGAGGTFDWAIFASPGGIQGQNHLTVTGDVFGRYNLALANNSKVFGDVIAQGSISTANNNTIGGNLHAGGSVAVYNSQTTVQGDALAGGAMTIQGKVLGDAQAGGPIALYPPGSVNGTQTPFSPPPSPVDPTMPTFTWDPANYASPRTWSESEDFEAHASGNRDAFSGHHRITDTDAIVFDRDWTAAGDVTIVSDGPITLSRDIANGSGGPITIVIVSFEDQDPAITFSNNVTLPATIELLLYAPNASIEFAQLKDFHGAVYGESVNLSQNFTLTWSPVSAPGFEFGDSSGSGGAGSTRYTVRAEVFREVPIDG